MGMNVSDWSKCVRGCYMGGLIRKHSCGESRLACIDCAGQICPSCMVQCPVGNRCPQCASRFSSHVLDVKKVVAIRTFAAACVVGALFGWWESLGAGAGIFGWFLLYFVGLLVGKVLHKIAAHKMGRKIVTCVICGLIVGAALPMHAQLLRAFDLNQSRAGCADDQPEATAGAAQAESTPPPLRIKGNQSSEPGIKSKNDKWQAFSTAFGALQQSTSNICLVKVPITESDVTENIWVAVSKIDGDTVTGTVYGQPKALASTQFGAPVQFKGGMVEDWKVVEKAKATADTNATADVADTRRSLTTTYYLMSFVWEIIAFILFSVGVLTPFFGWTPALRGLFRY